MTKTTRVLELSEQLQKNADDIIAICVLLDIPANSRISCLSNEDVQKIIDYSQENF